MKIAEIEIVQRLRPRGAEHLTPVYKIREVVESEEKSFKKADFYA